MNYELARHNMVESQIRPSDVTDLRIQNAMSTLPREKFLPSSRKTIAYSDEDIEVSEGRYLLAPRSLARLVQAAGIGADDVVLDLAPATGYSTAVLAQLASAVVAVEADAALLKKASKVLSDLAIDNTAIIEGAPSAGCPDQAPFDVIFINGTVDFVPDELIAQLSDHGRLVTILADDRGSHGCIYRKHSVKVVGNSGAGQPVVDCTRVFDLFAPKLEEFSRKQAFTFNFG